MAAAKRHCLSAWEFVKFATIWQVIYNPLTFLFPSKCFFFLFFFFFRHVLPAFCQDFHHFSFVLGTPSNFSRSVCSGLLSAMTLKASPSWNEDLRTLEIPRDPGKLPQWDSGVYVAWFSYMRQLLGFVYETTTSNNRNAVIWKVLWSSVDSFPLYLGLGHILNI